MTCCPANLVAGRPASSSPVLSRWELVSRLYLPDEPSLSPIPDGPYVMANGDTWTFLNGAAAATRRFVAGTGMQFAAAAAITQWNSAGGAQTAWGMYAELETLIDDYDCNAQYLFQAHVSSNNADAATEIVFLNLWQPANNQYAGQGIIIGGGCYGSNATLAPALGVGATQQTATPVLISTVGATNPRYDSHNVIGITTSPGNPSALAASSGRVVAGVWPSMSELQECGWVQSTATPAALAAVRFTNGSTRLGVNFPTGNGSGTFAATLDEIRVYARNPSAP